MVHGTTLVTNALIERKGVLTGMIATAGYRDVLEIGTELRYDPFDLQIERSPNLVARRLRKVVKERIGANGEVVLPLDEDGVRQAARELKASGVKSIAIVFLNSYRNPVHEQRAKKVAREECGVGIAICTSSEIAPEIREYERFSTCAANAYIAPIATQVSRRIREIVRRAVIHHAFRRRNHDGACRERTAYRAGGIRPCGRSDGRRVPRQAGGMGQRHRFRHGRDDRQGQPRAWRIAASHA